MIKVIRFDNVCKTYPNGVQAVDRLSLDIAEGETLVLLGTSGCGKTTTLKMMNRLIEPSSGQITINGIDIMEQNIIELRRSIGYVFQGIGLFPHLTVRQNIEITPRLLGWSKTHRKQRVEELIQLVGLDRETFAPRYPEELSGGQQQRIGVARALAADPALLLMDEPFGALDAVTRDTLQTELLSLKAKLNKTIVFVTHDIFEALILGDRIAVLHNGNLEQVGKKEELVKHPATDFVFSLFAKPANQLSSFQELF